MNGGVKYFADRLLEFEGNVEKALAAYNCGSNNVHKYNGIPPFKETQSYVEKVLEDYDNIVENYNKKNIKVELRAELDVNEEDEKKIENFTKALEEVPTKVWVKVFMGDKAASALELDISEILFDQVKRKFNR
ncbi:lytic transglycosylase domain-containing protein [Metabacillus sp. Hm71]|uniref:lytic transglycosylase domain-containing protein n=1 Tax=Metabacillus sp. Hm71 TaxID=3450743 RepID=UPI003F44443A